MSKYCAVQLRVPVRVTVLSNSTAVEAARSETCAAKEPEHAKRLQESAGAHLGNNTGQKKGRQRDMEDKERPREWGPGVQDMNTCVLSANLDFDSRLQHVSCCVPDESPDSSRISR